MKRVHPRAWILLVVCLVGAFSLVLWGQDPPRFSGIRRVTNAEIALTLSVSNAQVYRVDTSSNLARWSAWITLQATNTSLQLTDTAAPYLSHRLYRTERLNGTNAFTGDHIETTNGIVTIRPLNHATFLMQWNGRMIYNDPVSAAGPYTSFPKADLILVSHNHSDHFGTATIDGVRGPNTVIIAPRNTTNSMSTTLRSLTTVLTNGMSTTAHGITIDAVPAYNQNHPRGDGNGYVLTIADKRFYMSGDTSNVVEMASLQNIDVAFVCMNIPFTMDHTNAANIVRAFAPRIIYPYHYRNGNGTFPDLGDFKRRVGQDRSVEVRLRKWY